MQPVATPFFFYLLSGLTILGGILVITRKNPVHSALALILTLLAQAGLYLMLYAPFVAGVQIILYAGGIMVLFLFVIMLVNRGSFCARRSLGLRVHQRTVVVSRPSRRSTGAIQHAADRRHAVWELFVPVRDRLDVAAGGDHRCGVDGEKKDLVVSRK
jgi:uncharacterized MnhB-related membrane protein